MLFDRMDGKITLTSINAGRLYVMAGKGTTPSVMVAFTSAVHDRQSAAHEEYYRGDNQQRGFHVLSLWKPIGL